MKKPLQSYQAVIAYTSGSGNVELWTQKIEAASQLSAARLANERFNAMIGNDYIDATSTRVFPMGPAHLGNAVKQALQANDGACLDNEPEVGRVARKVVHAISRRT